MTQVILKNISKTFNGIEVIQDLNLTIPSGSFTVLVGPSGCGKSTTLRMIAGLEQPTSGEIRIGDKVVTDLEPGQRDIAMVFQNYALYPTMTVKQNIEFGLKNRKIPKQERVKLIDEISEIVGLSDYLNRKPSELSGGQRQRVALARAMVKKPKVFLMDEPLSNLDAQLRQQMRVELMELHKTLGTTFIYVTHDQVEAMSMGDQIVILDKGDIQQVDNPINIYQEPENVFVSKFIGSPPMNVLPLNNKMFPQYSFGEIKSFGIRPEKIVVLNDRDLSKELLKELSKEGILVKGKIRTQEMLGAETLYYVESELGKFTVKSYDLPAEAESQQTFLFPFNALKFFDQQGNRVEHLVREMERVLA